MLQKLARALRYLFYRSYVYQLTQWKGDAGTAAVAATIAIAVAIFINVSTALTLVFSVLQKHIPPKIVMAPGLPPIRTAYIAVAGVLIFAQLLYLFYTKDGKDREIVKEYAAEDSSARRRRTTYIYIYAAITVISFILSLVTATFSAHST